MMRTEKAIKPTRVEMELLEALWRLGSASIREIQESLSESRRLEYTTVQTVVYRLEQKRRGEEGQEDRQCYTYSSRS